VKACGTLTARLGDISFLNCAPIRWGLADSGAVRDVDLVPWSSRFGGVRREFAEARPDAVREVQAALTGRGRAGLVASHGGGGRGGSRDARRPAGALKVPVLLDYYRALDYSLGERQLAAIQEFTERAAARGEMPFPMSARIPIAGGQT
jgi:chorismate dehydratase